MELELKHLAPYLPYKLKCQVTDKRKRKIATLGGLYNDGNCVFHDTIESEKGFKRIKPIFLPMSSLYTEMEDGKVPAIELAKIANPKTTWTLQPDCNFPLSNIGELFAWTIDENEFYFHLEWKDYSKHYFNQLGCFQYLFENHFDVFGLIDKGLALDKTKI